MSIKYVLKKIIFIFLILSIILFIYFIIKTSLNNSIEGLHTIPETDIIMNKEDAFCESHRGSSNILEESCEKLTHNNCRSTSCCVWTSDKKCVAGGKDGPTFNTVSKGRTKKLDYYYFKDLCFGEKCVK